MKNTENISDNKYKEVNLKAMGLSVKKYRNIKGISAEKLGEITKISKSHINNIESASSNASVEMLVRIANALDVTMDMLLYDSLKSNKIQEKRVMEYAYLFDDCTKEEASIIIETSSKLKEKLKEVRINSQGDDIVCWYQLNSVL